MNGIVLLLSATVTLLGSTVSPALGAESPISLLMDNLNCSEMEGLY